MKSLLPRKSIYKIKIFISIFIITIIPLTILGIFSYKTYIAEVSAKIDTSMKATQTQLKNRVENVMDSIRTYYVEIESKDEFKWLNDPEKNKGYRDYVNLKKVSNLLLGPVFLREYIESYIYVDLKQGYTFSNTGIMNLENVSNLDELKEFLKKGKSDTSAVRWENYLDVKEPDITGKNNEVAIEGYMLVLSFPFLQAEPESYLIVKLSRSHLYNIIKEGMGDIKAAVIDKNGKLVYGTDDVLTQYFLKQKLSNAGEAVDSVKMWNGETYHITASISPTSGLQYAVGYNRSIVKEGAQRILSFAVIIFIILCLLFALLLVGTIIIYRPIGSLKRQISPYLSENENGDEFKLIHKGIEAMADSKTSLERLVNKQKRLLLELFMTRMVRGELNSEQIHQNLERFQIVARNSFQIIAVQTDFLEEDSIEDITQIDAVRLEILEQIPEYILNALFLPPISYANAIIFIIGADRDEELDAEKIYRDIKQFITRQYPCYMTGGVCKIFHKLIHLRTALNESMEALKSLKVKEAGSNREPDITYYEELGNNQEQRYGYELLYEQEIHQAIDNGNAEQACGIMNQFVDCIFARKVSLSDRSFYLNRFLVAMLKVATDTGLSMVQIFKTEQINIFTYFSQICDERKIREFYKDKIILPIIESLMVFRRKPSTDILENVLELVKAFNADITLAECADKLNCHPSYIWKVLKNEKNMTFSDFVALEKLEMAKDMLKNTDLTITEIAAKLNYANTQNFIRFFCKHEHVSPGKYKASLKKT